SIPAAGAFVPTVALAVDRSQGWHRGAIYATWTDASSATGSFDVFLSSTIDGGWSAPRRANDDATGTRQDQFMPRIAADPIDGSINLAWYDTRLDPTNRLATCFAARSTDGGLTLPNVRVATRGPDGTTPPSALGQLGIAVNGGTFWPVWTDTRSGT